MIIGVPKEIKNEEHRVGLLPDGAARLTARGHQVVVERGAGLDAGYPDADYAAAGAHLTDSHDEPFLRGELIVKIKEPLPSEYGYFEKGKILFTYLHLAANRGLTDALLQSGVTAIAYETVTVQNRLPLLEPMSEIAGRMSVIVGGHFLAKPHGGKGVLLGGVPGVLPGRVVVIGGGTSGINAGASVRT
jgi:alanine dehydrogenase